MFKKLLVASLLYVICLVSSASAHYLWVSIDAKTGDHGTANIYFEEGPAPGDGHYLDPIIKSGKTWVRSVENIKARELETQEVTGPKQRWISGGLPFAGPRSIDSYARFGVYRYGKTDVLLHYYARALEVDSHDDLHELARAKHLDLDMVLHDEADAVNVTVLWKGKPAAGRTVYIRGPKGFRKNPKTDDNGRASFEPIEQGRYLLRTNVEEDTPGKEGDKEYALIRHHATTVITLPLKK